MTTLSWISRGGPPVALLAVALTIAPAGAANSPQHRYSITASLTPSGVSTTAANGGVEMKSTLSRPASGNDVQSGGSYVVMAKIVASPMGCASDTIFVDGFE
ncbi:MAG: hypothetical protein ABIR62_13470 [Dokdonella sp.]|uniref:hypothetical protein n=1 Tax=Dokdonella sp. TaxID=2291710 RepID=UPI003267BC87